MQKSLRSCLHFTVINRLIPNQTLPRGKGYLKNIKKNTPPLPLKEFKIDGIDRHVCKLENVLDGHHA